MKLAISFLLSLLLIVPISLAIEMTEIMYAPTADWGNQYNEWIELYNPSDQPILLDSWILNTTTGKNISGSIPAGGYLIVAKKPEVFSSLYPVSCPVVKGSFVLNNDGTTITLYNSNTLVDSWTYDNSLAMKNNRSLERDGESEQDGGNPCVGSTVPDPEPPLDINTNQEPTEIKPEPITRSSVEYAIIDDELKPPSDIDITQEPIIQEINSPTGFTLADPIGILKSLLYSGWINLANWINSLF